jgi:hypothetical protein
MLYMLRRAELGDEIVLRDPTSESNSVVFSGVLAENNFGQLHFRSPFGNALSLHDLMGIDGEIHWGVGNTCCYDSETQYPVWRTADFSWERVDKLGLLLDGGGAASDFFTFGLGGRIANGAKLGKNAENIARAFAVLDVSNGLRPALRALFSDSPMSDEEILGLFADAAGVPIPIIPDLFGIYLNLQSAGLEKSP